MRRLLVLLAATAMTFSLAGPVLAAPGASGANAVHYYLSLGDSLAAGYQPAPVGDPDDMFRTNQGYTDQLYRMAKAHFPKLRHVKLGCPGETTVSFMQGGEPGCTFEEGSQLAQAVEFLRAHRKFVSFVTIDIGWNDFPCQDSIACIPPGAAQISQNLPKILGALRAAAGPDIPIVGGTVYDPFLVYWLQGTPEAQALARMSVDDAIVPINDMIEGIYGAFGMPVADVEGAFLTTDWTMVTVPGLGEVPRNVAMVCAGSWVCVTNGVDYHATTEGYRWMALAWRAKLGF